MMDKLPISNHTIPDYFKMPRHKVFQARAYRSHILTQDDYKVLQRAGKQYSGNLNQIRPHKNQDGLKYADQLIASLHNENASHSNWKQEVGLAEEPQKYVYEIVLEDEQVQFRWGLPTTTRQREFRRQISGLYPTTEIKHVDNPIPNISPGMHVSGGQLELINQKYRPLKTIGGSDGFENDPYQSILNEMVGFQNETIILQIVFTPVGDEWTSGSLIPYSESVDTAAGGLEWGRCGGTYLNPKKEDPTAKMLRAAKAIREQEGRQAFYVNIRYLAFAPNAKAAMDHAHGIGSLVSSTYHNDDIDQALVALPYQNDGIIEGARRTFAREYYFNHTALNVDELSSLAHLPGEEVEGPHIDWTRKGIGGRPPAAMDRTTTPPDLTLDRDISNISGSDFEVEVLTDGAAVATDDDSEDTTDEDNEPLAKRIANTINAAKEAIPFTDSESSSQTDQPSEEDSAHINTEIKTDTPEKKEAFNEVYRQFFTGEMTREKIESRYNEHVADNLIRKLKEKRAEEMGVSLEELEQHMDLMDKKIASQNAPSEPSSDQDSQPEEASPRDKEADQNTTQQETESTPPENSGLPVAVPEDGASEKSGPPETIDSEPPIDPDQVPTVKDKGTNSQAHHSNYLYDEADTDVVLRREPGLQRFYPFEVKSYASGEGDGIAEEGDVFSGFDVRDRLINAHAKHPDEPIWLGYDQNPTDGIREIGWDKFSWFRHATIFGTTGKGKSTLLNNIIGQIARKGHGLVFIDPKGDTIDDLITQLPENRMEDIVWIEPGSERFKKVVGINFLEPGDYETEKEYNKEVESIIDDLRAVLRGGEYWGPKMEGITTNIARAMIRSRRHFTLVDMYYVLLDEESREKFVSVVKEEGMDFILEYTQKIAEMDTEEVDPVLRRIQDWIEDPISRGIVAHREGTINLSDAVEDGKIILVRNAVRSEEIQRVVATGIMRRIWSTIRKREKIDEKDREPFFAIMDEFDDIASENMALDKMLSKARAGKMGVITCLQNPSQIEETAPQTLKQMFGNSETMISFGVTDPVDGRLIASRFDDDKIDKTTLTNLPAFSAITAVTVTDEEGPATTDPLVPDMFADYPPLRSKKDAYKQISKNLEEYGVPPLEQDLSESKSILMHIGTDASAETAFLESVWAEQLRQNALDVIEPDYNKLDPDPPLNIDTHPSRGSEDDNTNTVAVKDAAAGFQKRTGKSLDDLPDGISISKEYITVVDPEDKGRTRKNEQADKIRLTDPDAQVSVTDQGIRACLDKTEEDWRPDTEKHREVLRRAFILYSILGFEVEIIQQLDGKSLPDALAHPPIETTIDIKQARKALEEFESDYPIAAGLSNNGTIAIEAETQTYKKPAQTFKNLSRAYKNGNKCVFITPFEEAEESTKPTFRINNTLTDPDFIRGHIRVKPNEDKSDVANVENREPLEYYYNKTEYLDLGTPDDGQRKHALLERGEQAIWIRTDDNQLTLYNGLVDGKRRGELRISEKMGSTNPFQYWCRYDQYNSEWVVYTGGIQERYDTLKELEQDWQLVYEPFVPEREFDEIPSQDDWEIQQTNLPPLLSPAGNSKQEPIKQKKPEIKPEYEDLNIIPRSAVNSDSPSESPPEKSKIARAGFTRERIKPFERFIDQSSNRASSKDSPKPNSPNSNSDSEVSGKFKSIIPPDHQEKYSNFEAVKIDSPDPLNLENNEIAAEVETEQPPSDPPDEPEETSHQEENDQETNDQEPTVEAKVEDSFTDAINEDSEVDIGILGPESEDNNEAPKEIIQVISTMEFTKESAMENLDEQFIDSGSLEDDDPIKINKTYLQSRLGSKDPTKSSFWTKIWSKANVSQSEPILEKNFAGAVLHTGLRSTLVEDAINIGLVTGAILPGGGEGDAMLRLPRPRDAYDSHLTEDEIKEFQRFDVWKSIWDELGYSPQEELEFSMICLGMDFKYEFDKTKSDAALGAGLDVEVIKEHGKGMKLGERTTPPYWMGILESMEKEPHDTVPRPAMVIKLHRYEDISEDQAKKIIELGEEHGSIYETQSGRLAINTPRDSKGPEIAEEAYQLGTYTNLANSDDPAENNNSSTSEPHESPNTSLTTDETDGPSTDTQEQATDPGEELLDPIATTDTDTPDHEDTATRLDQGSEANSPENQNPGPSTTDENVIGDGIGHLEPPLENDAELESQAKPTREESHNPTKTTDNGESGQAEKDESAEKKDLASEFEWREVSYEAEPESEQESKQDEESNGTLSETESEADTGSVEPPEPESEAQSESTTEREEEQKSEPEPESDSNPEAESESEPAQEKKPLADDTELNSTFEGVDMEAVMLKPKPDLSDVQKCLEASADFFHDQIDTTIKNNVNWNSTHAINAGYRKPETPREYFTTPKESPQPYPVNPNSNNPTGVVPTDNAATDDRTPKAFANDNQPYQYLGTATRGWTDTIIEEKKLGWAPANAYALFDYLRDQGFEHHTMIATGLFVHPDDAGGETTDGEQWVDYTVVDDPNDLRCSFCSRYVFPYYDEHGQVASFIARAPDFDTEYGTHENDFIKGKYAKLSTSKEYTVTDEPIYGRQTIRDGEPLVITEGMADAITAHAYGIPCISPVTVKFKLEHHETLKEIITEHNIPDVYFVQDSDPPQITESVEEQPEYENACSRAMELRDQFVHGDLPGGLTREQLVDAYRDGTLETTLEEADVDADADEVPIHLLTSRAEGPIRPGPISKALTIGQYGPGIEGAVEVGEVLDASTPDRHTTETTTMELAAKVYETHVVNSDTPVSAEDLHAKLRDAQAAENAADPEDTQQDTLTGEIAESEREAAQNDYCGTNVSVIELPQFADEKRDLDDYLQEGWLTLMPPATWAFDLVIDDYPTGNLGATERAQRTPQWIADLTDRNNHLSDYPVGVDPHSVLFPPANAETTHTYGSYPAGADQRSAVADPFVDVDSLAAEPYMPDDLLERADEYRWTAGSLQEIMRSGYVSGPYHHAALFGLLPTIHPSQHPAATGATATDQSDGTEMDIDPDEIDERANKNEWRELTGQYNPLWKITLSDFGLKPGSRGKNPFGHFGVSENYFKVFSKDAAYCFKGKQLYNAKHAMLIEADERTVKSPGGPLSDWEYFAAWKYAQNNGLVPDHTPIPIKGLIGYAFRYDIAGPEDLEPWGSSTGDGSETNAGSSGSLSSSTGRLSGSDYYETLKHIEANHDITPPQLETAREDGKIGNQNSNETEKMSWDKAVDKFGFRYLDMEDAPGTFQQFINSFAEIDTDIDDPKESDIIIPREDLREAFYKWVDYVNEYHEKSPHKEAVNLKKPSPASLGITISKTDNIVKTRPRLDGEQIRCYAGIGLNEEGKKLFNAEKE